MSFLLIMLFWVSQNISPLMNLFTTALISYNFMLSVVFLLLSCRKKKQKLLPFYVCAISHRACQYNGVHFVPLVLAEDVTNNLDVTIPAHPKDYTSNVFTGTTTGSHCSIIGRRPSASKFWVLPHFTSRSKSADQFFLRHDQFFHWPIFLRHDFYD